MRKPIGSRLAIVDIMVVFGWSVRFLLAADGSRSGMCIARSNTAATAPMGRLM